MGYSTTNTLLPCAPPWALEMIIAFIVARHSNKTEEGAFHIMIPFIVGVMDLANFLSTMNTTGRYVAILFPPASAYLTDNSLSLRN